jgi:hypothetical protein
MMKKKLKGTPEYAITGGGTLKGKNPQEVIRCALPSIAIDITRS